MSTLVQYPRPSYIPELYFTITGEYTRLISLRYDFNIGVRFPCPNVVPPLGFADQNWRNPNRRVYMRALKVHNPDIATVLDLERPEQFDEVMDWAEEAARYVKKAVIIIPKITSVIDRIPDEIGGKKVYLGYSVPSNFCTTAIPLNEFKGRPLHLLGGNPLMQIKICAATPNVQTTDVNMTSKMADTLCSYLTSNLGTQGFVTLSETGIPFAANAHIRAFELSCANTYIAWHYSPPCYVRYASPKDLDDFREIDHWVPRDPSLTDDVIRKYIREHLAWSAVQGNKVVGYYVSDRASNGYTRILHLAIHPDHRRRYIGSSLLSTIRYTSEITIPSSNSIMQVFLEANGYRRVSQNGEMATWKRKMEYSPQRIIAEIQLRTFFDKHTLTVSDKGQRSILTSKSLNGIYETVDWMDANMYKEGSPPLWQSNDDIPDFGDVSVAPDDELEYDALLHQLEEGK